MTLKWKGPAADLFKEKALFRKGESSTLPLHIALIVDCSKSMGDKIGKTKQALYYFLERLDSNTRVGIVSLGEGGVQIREGLTDDIELLKSILADLETGSASPLGAAIPLADEELLNDQEAIRVILLFSDGQVKDEATTMNAANRARARGTRLISFGLGAKLNRDLLQEIASSSTDYHLMSEGTRFSQKLLDVSKDLRKVDYFPIGISCLLPNHSLDFNLFTKMGEGCRLFLARSLPFEEQIREKLEESGTDTLFIHSQDRDKYRRYLGACLELGLLDREILKSFILFLGSPG